MAFTLAQKIKTVLKLISEPKILSSLISQRDYGYLFDIGWFESFKIKKAIDKSGNPIPWFTYPFIDFIDYRLNDEHIIFEYGSGNSTLYFSKRVKKIFSVEHSKEWFNVIKKSLPDNSELFLTNSNIEKDYLEPQNSSKIKADIVIIDGLHRNACIKNSIKYLSETGVIILDDSERFEYKDGIKILIDEKFKRIDFWGIAPTVLFKKCTSLFYKSQNSLGV